MEQQEEFDPYAEAGKIDRQISSLLRDHPISEETLAAWTIFQRTVQSTLNIIEESTERVAKDAATRPRDT